ncbi:2-oxoglutarate/2-oxoacid ferredoxin oxidoreductase subunit alpha [uncultured Gammaproteobacteria bacterium]
MSVESLSLALVGSGGAGVMTVGQMLLDAAAGAGWYGMMRRSSGPQIRGGEAAALVDLATRSVEAPKDEMNVLLAIDWQNTTRFMDELPLTPDSIIIADPSQGPVPELILARGARVIELPIKDLAAGVVNGRANMVALGAAAAIAGLPMAGILSVVNLTLGRKGGEAQAAAATCLALGAKAAEEWGLGRELATPAHAEASVRWNISGNEAAGLGAVRGGVRFCAAYPITPATEVLEWLAGKLPKLGGTLVQAEDELASIAMCIGASYGGVPSITATSGPGLALMTELMGLSVSSETPVVVVNVMRGGPSTGIPTKAEQTDLNIAIHGLHGDAPHIVLGPTSVGDCVRTTQWAVHLAERLQTLAIVLSDQALGQTRAVIDRPDDSAWQAERLIQREAGTDKFKRYAATPSGVSAMSIPGTPGLEYVAEGLEHSESGLPSAGAADHAKQLDKRLRKLDNHNFGPEWADVEGEGEVAVLTWGSCTGPARAAVARLAAEGRKARLVAVRLLSPARPSDFAQALAGVRKLLVVELSHGAQFYRYLRSQYDLPGEVTVFNRPGPLSIRTTEIYDRLVALGV